MGFFLTPEQKKAVGFTSEDGSQTVDQMITNEKSVGSGFANSPLMSEDPNVLDQYDLDDEQIKREQEEQVFDGSTYNKVPGTVENMLGKVSPEMEEAQAANQKLYEAQGEPLIPGVEGGPRLQRSVDKTGEQETQFVPPPSFGPVERSVTGAGLELAKGVAGVGALAAESLDGRNYWNAAIGALPLSEELKKQLTVANPDATQWVRENMPTMPAASGGEKIAQEIGSIVLGGLGGGKLATEAIERLPQAQRMIAEAASSFLEGELKKNGGLDVVNAQQKTELLIKSMVTEFVGANTGATIATPDDVEALTGSNFIDNTAASGLFRVLGLTGKGIANAFSRGTGGNATAQMSEAGLAADMFRQIDPDIAGASKQEIAKRMGLFSEVLSQNSETVFPGGSFPSMSKSPQEAMALGARQYVDKAYGYLKNSMKPDDYEAWAAGKAAQIADNIQAIKRDNLGHTAVQTADASTLNKGKLALAGAADNVGPEAASVAAAARVAEQPLQALNNAKFAIDAGKQGVESAQNRVDQMINDDVFLSAVDKNRGGTAADNYVNNIEQKRELAGNAKQAWEKSYKDYNDKFNSLPSGKDFDRQGMAALISHYGNQVDPNELLHLDDVASTTGFAPVTDALSLEQQLGQIDLKYLVSKVRPQLVRKVSEAKRTGKAVDTSGYDDMIKFIDEEAEKFGGAFKEAKDAYKTHAQTWQQIDELKAINEQAKVSTGAIQKEADQTYREFYDFQNDALRTPNDESGVKLANYMKAYDIDNPTATKLLMAEVTDALANADPKNIRELSQAVKPYLPKIKTVDPEAYDLISGALSEVDNASSGLMDAKDALAKYTQRAQEVREQVADTAANNFINTSEVGSRFTSESATGKLNKIFQDPTETKKLMLEAKDLGDPLVLDGLQGQYLRYLTDNVFTSRVVSQTGDAGRAVNEASVAKLNKILDGSDAGQREIMQAVFANKPEFLSDLDLLLTTIRDNVNVRTNRVQTGTSNTAVDNARNARQQAASLLTTALFGRLNRTAATIGAFSKAINTAWGANEQAILDKVVPMLISDTKTLTRALDEIVANPDKKVLDHIADGLVSNQAKLSNTAKGAMTTLKPETESNDDTENALGMK